MALLCAVVRWRAVVCPAVQVRAGGLLAGAPYFTGVLEREGDGVAGAGVVFVRDAVDEFAATHGDLRVYNTYGEDGCNRRCSTWYILKC